MSERPPVGPTDALQVPRFAGPTTYARLPTLDAVEKAAVAVVGVPFDSGVVYRPGARFGPAAVRAGSRLIRPYNAWTGALPFAARQVADAGDIACTPFAIDQAIGEIERGAAATLERADHLLALGGDHTIALPLLRATKNRFGRLALVHFDAHLDTWDSFFGARYTHGTPFRRAAEEGLLDLTHSVHVGTRGPQFAKGDLEADAQLGFHLIDGRAIDESGPKAIAKEVKERVGEAAVYLSFDIDLLDPAFAPGTGTPEAGGWSSREAIAVLRALAGVRLVGGDVVEVAPAYDHGEITAVAAAHIVYEMLCIFP